MRRQRASLASLQWRLADEVVAVGEALRVAEQPLEAAHTLLVLALRACRELEEARARRQLAGQKLRMRQ